MPFKQTNRPRKPERLNKINVHRITASEEISKRTPESIVYFDHI